MPAELARFQNFAKLKDTQIAFNDITVLAGKPGTGKSYIMKFMYAINETLSSINNGNYKIHFALMDGNNQEQELFTAFRSFLNFDDTIDKLIDENNYIKALEVLNLDTSHNQDESLFNMFKEYLEKFSKRQKDSLVATDEEKFHFIFRNILESIFGSIDQIDSNFSFSNKLVKIQYSDNEINLRQINFQKDIDGALFVETPLILEFEKFLPKERFKIPYHIDSLIQILNKNDFSFTSEETSNFINEFKKSTAKIINGNVSKESQGFSFVSNSGKNYNIINTSSGIKSIGLLQYLITSRAIKKGSVLYWEEPEVHLHPEWQLKMVDLFVELMNAGVKIVFSTHSPYMADYLNAISKKQKFRDRISFNVLDEKDEVVSNHILDDDNWNILQKELMDTFEDILWQYL